jgi:hypothetical protein
MILVTVFVLLTLTAPDLQQLRDYDVTHGEAGTVYHRGWQSWRGEDMGTYILRSVRRVESTLGREMARPLTTVLTPDRKSLHRVLTPILGRRPHDGLRGLALPGSDWIFVGGDGSVSTVTRGGDSYVTLLHEICHLVNHGGGARSIPRWFDEGVCMWVSRNVISPRDEAYLSGRARIGQIYRVSDLETEFPNLHLPGSIAYQQSQMMVAFLVERDGPDVLAQLLGELDSGLPFGEAYEMVTGSAWEEFEVQFSRWLSSRRSLLEVIASFVNVWTIIAILALAAIARSVLRSRKLLRKLEVEERGSPDDGGATPGADA